MSTFDDQFAAVARPVLKDQLGDSLTYTDPDGTVTTATGIIGEEGLDQTPDEHGRKHERVREVVLFKDDIADVSIRATLTIAGELWAVDEIVAETATETLVRCMRIEAAERSRPGYRQQP